MSEYIGQLCELELSTLEQTAKAFSQIRTSEEVLQARGGKSQRLGDGEITMTGVLKFLSSVDSGQHPDAGLECIADASCAIPTHLRIGVRGERRTFFSTFGRSATQS